MIKLTTEEEKNKFIENANLIHSSKYKYCNINYINAHSKINILCKLHGFFAQTPSNHLAGKGCKKCGYKTRGDKNKDSKTSVLRKFKNKHGKKYDYSLMVYSGTDIKIKILCRKHGVFEQTPNKHISGNGCRKCANERCAAKSIKKAKESLIANFKKVHGDQYIYNNVHYINSKIKVKITCRIHGEFEQLPRKHIKGQGCSFCGSHGFNTSTFAILYYLKINNGLAYKIGITNKSVKERFNNTDLEKIEVIKEWSYTIGKNAYDEEQRILKNFKIHKWMGLDLLENGNTELFTIDILQLDNKTL